MKRNTEIHTVSYIRVNGELVRFDSLSEDIKRKAATKIKITYFNELYKGKSTFFVDHSEENQNI